LKRQVIGYDDGVSTTEEPRWLDAEERAAWLSLAGMMTLLPAALDAQLQRDAGLSHFEYMVLAMLSERPSRTARMSELAGLANGSLSRLSHVARRLEAQGLITREACPDDGRATNAVLTDAGYAKVVETAPGHVENVRTLVFDALEPAQHDQLRAIGAAILGRVNPGGDCPR
jgi:DNA-binding MarR family transcriptional regulator